MTKYRINLSEEGTKRKTVKARAGVEAEESVVDLALVSQFPILPGEEEKPYNFGLLFIIRSID